LCAGEDRHEFLAALRAAGLKRFVIVEPDEESEYRGYQFLGFGEYCAILTGIGTGCLEPALWEILRPKIVEQIILVGTAGVMPGAVVDQGKPYFIDRAWPAGTGIDALAVELPLRPRWKGEPTTPTASSVSTDFYYGFGPKLGTDEYPLPHGPLNDLYSTHVRWGTQLVEMEVAQFYFFCELFGGECLEYAAVKAPANSVSDVAEQSANSPAALVAAVGAAVRMLDERTRPMK
jgi:hypothetical protein